MGKFKKEVKVKSKKVVFYDDENPVVKKMSIKRQRDCDGEVLLRLECPGRDKLFWLNKVQIQVMIDTLIQARDNAMEVDD